MPPKHKCLSTPSFPSLSPQQSSPFLECPALRPPSSRPQSPSTSTQPASSPRPALDPPPSGQGRSFPPSQASAPTELASASRFLPLFENPRAHNTSQSPPFPLAASPAWSTRPGGYSPFRPLLPSLLWLLGPAGVTARAHFSERPPPPPSADALPRQRSSLSPRREA